VHVWAVVVAAGRGERFGAPKQYEALGGRRVLDWALDAAGARAEGVVLVVPPERVAEPEPGATVVVAGAATRSGSVRAGLASVPPSAEVVLVHDAARPLAPPAVFDAVLDAVAAGADGAVPGLPVSDTVKRVAPDGTVLETLDRSALVTVQTPQAFRAGALRAAHAGGDDASDDAALVEAAGGRVVVVPGAAAGAKVTAPGDLPALEAELR
jgi:2-C-methyl-D-erythritol 4-phosphate cytidylyltransferase